MARNTIGFSAQTFRATGRATIKKEILNAVESSKDFRREISRVFQQANRRIQNVENSGVVSPAVTALNKGDIKGFTKFSMRNDWETLKLEYAKAVSFLQQPTSTATGTREYANHLKKTYNLSDTEFSIMQNKLMGKIASVSDERFLEQYLMQYKDFTGELETESKDISDQIESDAISFNNALENAIDDATNQVTDAISTILENFDKFGL